MKVKCQKCGKDGPNEPLYARVGGWRVWSGLTLGGRQSEVCYCPVCFGAVEPPEDEEPGWDAECVTCNTLMSDCTTEPITKEAAEAWEFDHQCEPEVFTLPPTKRRVSA